jgi:pilus assembly protein FimV
VNETNCSKFKKRAAALAVASCLSIAPWLANAAGLGKITVLSGLGQPLRAELEVSANRDELTGMTARLAPQEVFRQAGVDYSSTLLDLRFAIDKRANGQTVVKITSGKPVNEPFLDFLVELNWPAGRLIREYTFLLDPPEVAVKQAVRAVVDARVVETVPGGGAQPALAARPTAPPAPTSRVEPIARQDAGDTRVVRAGDNLRKIAAETQHDGVSLEQMLVGIFRKNPDAFVGNNMNRLKAGAILGLPDKETVASIPDGEAKRVFLAQASDWNSYRQKLAAVTSAAPAQEGAGSQMSSGQITARVEEKLAPAEQSKDQVKVARTDVAAPGSAGGRGSAESEADRIAREKALKEAQDRLAMLEKNVTELQKLVELKNQQLAELQQQATSKAAVEPVKAESPAKPVESPPVGAVVAPEAPKAVEEPAVKPDEPTQVADPQKVEEPKPVEPPKPVAPVTPPPEPVPEPGLLDAIFGNPLPLAGGVGILALLAGYFIYRRRRSDDVGAMETTAAPGPSSLGPNSVFRMTGGQSVDTANTPPQTGDFSQTGPGTIDTDEVDPVAEADVYMAYGRDTQAEEILLEALQKDPQRTAIHAKLLEIYANRRSLKQFETLASELYAQTGGVGVEWEKVAALGVTLDPKNPLYSGAAVKAPTFDSDATMVVPAGDVGKATLALAAGALAQMAAAESADEQKEVAESVSSEEFERYTPGLAEPEAPAEPVATVQDAPEESEQELGGLDFDLDMVTPEAAKMEQSPAVDSAFAEAERVPQVAASDALDFDISGDVPLSAAATTLGDVRLPANDALDLDVADEFSLPQTADISTTDSPGHDFSPEGTLLLQVPGDDEIDLHMEAAASTFVGEERQSKAKPQEEIPVEPMVDFDLDIDQAATATVVNSVADDLSTETPVNASPTQSGADVAAEHLSFDEAPTAGEHKALATPASEADLEFDVSLTDSVFLGQPMTASDFDMGSINLDLGAEPAATNVATEGAARAAFDQPVEHDAQWEEVNTKLDLAKAYEEMGDLEGARELLQEVVGEGSADLVEQAQAILVRIGE